MLVEHVFITTIEQVSTLQKTGEILGVLGYWQEAQSSSNAITYRRGVKPAPKVKRSDELPQRVAVNFDRGRVQLAISLEENQQLRGEKALQKEMLLSLATLLEACLTGREQFDNLRTNRDQSLAKIAKAYKRRIRIGHILLAACVFVIVATFVGAIIYNEYHAN